MAAHDSTNPSRTTVAELIEFYIRDVGQMQTFGASHLYALRRLQRHWIGAKVAAELTSGDIIQFCRERQKDGACPATVNQDVVFIRGPLKMARIMWGVPASLAPIEEATPLLSKLNLIGKSTPRDRRPNKEELETLLAYFREQDRHANAEIPMAIITEFQVASGRRISETCRLRWEDINYEEKTILVRDLKDPKRKKGTGNHAVAPLLGRAWEIIMAQPKVSDRIFPYSSKSCSARYTLAKRRLGIKNLRLHDSRREAISRLLEQGYSVPEAMLVSLHKNPTIMLRTYTKLKPADLHLGPAAKRNGTHQTAVHAAANDDPGAVPPALAA
jgi:integrase